MAAEKIDFQVVATTLMGAINDSVNGFLKVKMDNDPSIVTKPLYVQEKWNISTYGDFIDGSYVSVIYFFRHSRDRESKHYCGMLVVYVNTSVINYLVRVFGYKNAEQAGNEVSLDVVAELSNNIAGVFKKDLSGVGYPELEISSPLKFKGFSGELDYPKGQKNFHRVTAFVWGQTITVDVILAL